MRKYKKYSKKTRRKLKNPYILFLVFILGILVMGVGYSAFSEILTIEGEANAKYTLYEIEYNLKGGINPENAVKTFRIIDDIPLPIPTKTNYEFMGWYENENCLGERVITTLNKDRDLVLYAKWKYNGITEVEFQQNGEYVFTGSNYINTNVYLYSQENVKKNFIISFDIVSVAESNINHSALMNSMDETGKPWPGHVVKVSVTGQGKSVKFESNSNTSSTGDVFVSSNVRNIRILRYDEKLYYSFDGADFIVINNYKGFTDTFDDVPVTFGASMDGDRQPYRYFTGTLANMYVSFLADDAIVEGYNSHQKVLKTVYEYAGAYEFNGSSDYINTGVSLFSKENVDKDFEISFNIDYVGQQTGSQNTIINAKNERINSYPGFVYRLYQSSDGTARFEARGGTGSGAKNKIVDVHKVKIERKESKIYLTINDGNEKLVYDYSSFSNYFDIPLTIGASLDSNGNPFRYFNGTLSNIVVKLAENK